MKKLSLIFALVFACATSFAFNYNTVFTAEGVAAFEKEYNENDAIKNSKAKATFDVMIPVFKALQGRDPSTITYAEFKAEIEKLSDDPYILAHATYMTFCNRFNAAAVYAALMADPKVKDTFHVKFAYPACIQNQYIPNISAEDYYNLVADTLKKTAKITVYEKYRKAFFNTFFKKIDTSDANTALETLKKVKRDLYENIVISDEWKKYLTEIELKIRALN